VFSILDANKDYYQIPLDESPNIVNNIHHATHSRDFASIVCRWDYRYQRNHFQRSFSQILDKSKGIVNLVDNILVYETLEEEHDDNLGAVLKKLQEAEITLNRRKYKIRQRSVKFLGYISVERGIESDKNKIKAIIINIESSENATEVKRFPGPWRLPTKIHRAIGGFNKASQRGY